MDLVSIPANPVPEGAVTGMLKTRDGVSVRFARWHPPPGRKGTVCIFQGRAEFIEKYFETVRELRAAASPSPPSTGAARAAPSARCPIRARAMSATSRNTSATSRC